ncbi:hypothetical protein B0H13DRAFT_1933641 [Mycena leptocephala]|nr:hypothetical protein B0H13DRAFT_1933641 [Mycena leptocephala]
MLVNFPRLQRGRHGCANPQQWYTYFQDAWHLTVFETNHPIFLTQIQLDSTCEWKSRRTISKVKHEEHDAGSHTRGELKKDTPKLCQLHWSHEGPLVRNLTTDGQHCVGRNEDSFHAAVSDLTPVNTSKHMNTSQQEPLRMVLNLLHVQYLDCYPERETSVKYQLAKCWKVPALSFYTQTSSFAVAVLSCLSEREGLLEQMPHIPLQVEKHEAQGIYSATKVKMLAEEPGHGCDPLACALV